MARISNQLAKDSELPAQTINLEPEVNIDYTDYGTIFGNITYVIKDDSNFNERN